jgi:hypothetical protein
MSETLELRYVPLETLRRWDRNAKRHDLGALAASIARHGFRDPPAYDAALNGGEGGVVEGNGRGDALSAMLAEGRPVPRGIVAEGDTWLVPVLFGVDAESQAAAESYAVSHNNLTLSGGDFTALDMASLWEPAGYAALLEDLAQQGEIPVGLDGEDVDALLRELAGAPEPGAGGDEFDATPADGPTRAQSGDLWIIGGVHRLIVGDSTDPEVVARLMGGERAALCATDPPYNVSIEYGEAVDDDKSAEDYERFSRAWLALTQEHSERQIVTPGYENLARWLRWFDPFHVAPWTKLNSMKRVSRISTWSCWEPLLFFGEKWRRDRAHDVFEFSSSVQSLPTGETLSDLHPCPKPLSMWVDLYENYSERGDLVYEPFSGSGTSHVAAHRTGRRCYGVEISPRYADVILRRAEAEGLTVERAP